MSKAIAATCAASVVTADGKTVAGVTILSQGTKSSSGLLMLTEGEKKYITSNATDIADLIQSLNSMITSVCAILTAHDAGLGSTQTAAIAAITTANATLLATKENLK